jgi:hypothetical protein
MWEIFQLVQYWGVSFVFVLIYYANYNMKNYIILTILSSVYHHYHSNYSKLPYHHYHSNYSTLPYQHYNSNYSKLPLLPLSQ